MATKSTTRKSSTRAAASHRRAPTSAEDRRQERIAAQIAAMEREEAGLPPERIGRSTRSRGKPLRSRVASKIKGRKVRHYLARGLVHLTFGGGTVLFHGGRLAGKGGAWAGRKTVDHVVKRTQARKWSTHTPMTRSNGSGIRTLRRTSSVCMACGEHHTSIQDMNQHFLDVHKGEKAEPRTERKLPTIHKGATARTAGKVIVKLHPEAKRGPGKHRRNRRNPNKTRADHLVAAYGATIHQIGERSMAIGPSAAIARGFQSWADAMPGMEKRGAILEMQEMVAGLERAMAMASDTLANVAMELKKRNVAAEIVNPNFLAMQDNAQNIGVHATRFLAAFNDLYAPAIAQARRNVATPSPRFFGAAS